MIWQWVTFFILTLSLILLRASFTALESAAESASINEPDDSSENDERDETPQRTLLESRRVQLPVTIFIPVLLTVLLVVDTLTLVNNIFLTLFILTPLILIFTEYLPRRAGKIWSENLLDSLSKSLNTLNMILTPFLYGITWFSTKVLNTIDIDKPRYDYAISRDDIIEIIEEEEEEEEVPLTEEETSGRKLIAKILDLPNTMVREVMKPLDQVTAIHLPASQYAITTIANITGYTRLPIYRERIIDLIGYIDVLELLREDDPDASIEPFIKEARYVPETKNVDDLLQEFLDQNTRSAIVIDEHGSCSGWITREDILEEIVGEIDDEFDTEEQHLVQVEETVYHIPANMDLDDLEEKLNFDIPHQHYDTLGGFIYFELGRVPTKGEKIKYRNIELTVLEMQKHKIITVEIRILDQDDEN